MKRKDEEIGLVEIAALAKCHRQLVYWAVRYGEIKGGHQTLGRIWIAPRGEVMKWIRRREKEEQLRRQAAEDNPIAGAVAQIREGLEEVGAIYGDMARRLTGK